MKTLSAVSFEGFTEACDWPSAKKDSNSFYDKLQTLTWQLNIQAESFPNKFHPDNFRKANDLSRLKDELEVMARDAKPLVVRRAMVLRVLLIEVRQQFAPGSSNFLVSQQLVPGLHEFQVAAAKAILPKGLMPRQVMDILGRYKAWYETRCERDTSNEAIALFNTLCGYAEHHDLPIEAFPCRVPITAFPPPTLKKPGSEDKAIVTPEEYAKAIYGIK